MLLKKLINFIYKSNVHDIMTGLRAFSYDFVKSFPVMSKGFEIETEMTVFALDNNFKLYEIVMVAYRNQRALIGRKRLNGWQNMKIQD